MNRFSCRWLAGLMLLAFLAPVTLPAATGEEQPPEQPRLIVLVVIDQFRADYLERFRDRFGPGGFNRLLNGGAHFPACFYQYAMTTTAPGHATLATGTTPNRHGIANNSWYDLKQGRIVQAVEDVSSPAVGGGPNALGVSPVNLKVATLAEKLLEATGGKAKVFGVSLKDRSAVFATGRRATGAYWYNTETGRFITSRYYREALPEWVVEFNRTSGAGSYSGREWVFAGEGDNGEGRIALSLPVEAGRPNPGLYREIWKTPYGNDLLLDFARALVEREGLGQDEVPDFLAVGLSSNDSVGHMWGPDSEEVADMVVRTDSQFADWLKFLDAQVGAENYWLVLSSDHGVAPTLRQARARGLPAKDIQFRALATAIYQAITERWGPDNWFIPNAGLMFNRGTVLKHRITLAEAVRTAGEGAMTVDGVAGFAGLGAAKASKDLIKAYRLSSYRNREADIMIFREPFATINGGTSGANHGSPHEYDQHVPLIFYGPAFQPGVYRRRVSPADAAPTLARALGIPRLKKATGRVLPEALRRAGKN